MRKRRGWRAAVPLMSRYPSEIRDPDIESGYLKNAVIEEDRERSRSAKTATTDLEQTHLSEIVLDVD